MHFEKMTGVPLAVQLFLWLIGSLNATTGHRNALISRPLVWTDSWSSQQGFIYLFICCLRLRSGGTFWFDPAVSLDLDIYSITEAVSTGTDPIYQNQLCNKSQPVCFPTQTLWPGLKETKQTKPKNPARNKTKQKLDNQWHHECVDYLRPLPEATLGWGKKAATATALQ